MMIHIYTELGHEKLCPLCGEYYPLDEDFFYKNGFKRGVQQWTGRCKACYIETYRGDR